MSRETIIFDLDHTLLNTQALKGAIAVIESRLGGLPEARDGAVAALAATCRHFLFEGAEELLARLRAEGAELVLLTRGETAWQQAKIDGAGIAGHFHRVIVTEGEKADIIGDFAALGQRAVFVNDNIEECVAMRRAAPECRFIVKRGPKPEPENHGFVVCESVADVARELKMQAA